MRLLQSTKNKREEADMETGVDPGQAEEQENGEDEEEQIF